MTLFFARKYCLVGMVYDVGVWKNPARYPPVDFCFILHMQGVQGEHRRFEDGTVIAALPQRENMGRCFRCF